MKLAIIGSREFKHLYLVEKIFIIFYKEKEVWINPDYLKTIEIISGGASGPDTEAFKISKKYNLSYKQYDANWEKFGKKAGFIRNTTIVEECDSALVFWDQHSNGTRDTIIKLIEFARPFVLTYQSAFSMQYTQF